MIVYGPDVPLYSTVPESVSRFDTFVSVSPPCSLKVPLLLTAAAELKVKLFPARSNVLPLLIVSALNQGEIASIG